MPGIYLQHLGKRARKAQDQSTPAYRETKQLAITNISRNQISENTEEVIPVVLR